MAFPLHPRHASRQVKLHQSSVCYNPFWIKKMNWVQFSLGIIFAFLSLFWLLSVLYKVFTVGRRKDEGGGGAGSWLFPLGFSIVMLVLSLAALITAF